MKPEIGKFVQYTSIVYPETIPDSHDDCRIREEIAKRRNVIAEKRAEIAACRQIDLELAEATAKAIAADAPPEEPADPEIKLTPEDEEARKRKLEAEAEARRAESQAFLAGAMQLLDAQVAEKEAPLAEEEAQTIEDERALVLAAQTANPGKEVVKLAMIVDARPKENLPEDDESSWEVDLQIFPGAGRVFSSVPFSRESKALHWNWPPG